MAIDETKLFMMGPVKDVAIYRIVLAVTD